MYYYQQRYYDPVLSRFVSADPLYLEEMNKRGVDSLELNIFAYVRGNPVRYIDPTGNLVEVFSRSVDGTFDQGRHLFIRISDQPNGAPDRIISLEGKILGGTPTVSTTDGFANDRASLENGTFKDSQVVAAPDGMSQKAFEQKIIDFAKGYNVNAPENRYPIFGGVFNSESRHSNTFVDDAIESAGGTLKNFTDALNQNVGDNNSGTFFDSSGAHESTK